MLFLSNKLWANIRVLHKDMIEFIKMGKTLSFKAIKKNSKLCAAIT